MEKFNEIDKVIDTSTATSVINDYKKEKQMINKIKMKPECIEWEMNMFKIYHSKFNDKIYYF